MSRLPLESAGSLLLEYAGWFGSPALLRTYPSQIEPAAYDCGVFLDGHVRFMAVAASPRWLQIWRDGEFPHFVFPIGHKQGLYSIDGGKLLPRMLVFAGHHDRAWEYIPEVWRDGARGIQMFLDVPMVDAMCVWAVRRRLRDPRRIFHPSPAHRYNQIIARIRAGLLELEETGQGFDLDDVRRLVK